MSDMRLVYDGDEITIYLGAMNDQFEMDYRVVDKARNGKVYTGGTFGCGVDQAIWLLKKSYISPTGERR